MELRNPQSIIEEIGYIARKAASAKDEITTTNLKQQLEKLDDYIETHRNQYDLFHPNMNYDSLSRALAKAAMTIEIQSAQIIQKTSDQKESLQKLGYNL